MNMFGHRAAIQWSNLINAEARTTFSSNRNSTSTHRHTSQMDHDILQYVIDCTQVRAQDNIHTLHQAWQILQADGAHDKHREMKLAAVERKRRLCVSGCLNCTHVCEAADVSFQM